MDYLVAGQRAPGSPKRTEALAGVNPPLDGPVVLLQDIIEVRHQPVLAAGVQRSFTLELSDRGRVSRMPMVLLPADVTDCMWLYWKIAEGLRHEVNGMFGRQPVLRDFRWRLGGIF